MKKNKLFNLSLVMFFITVFLPKISFSQEIIDVPTEWEGSPYGVINRFIMSDTTSSGERAHPNCIYRLKRGEYYDIDHALNVDFNFTLIGESAPKGTGPAMVSRGVDAQGKYISGLINIIGDSTNVKFANILFNGVQDDNKIVNQGGSLFGVFGTHHRFEIDSCVFSGWGGNLFNSRDAARMTYIITNSIFRNGVDLDNPWSGNIYSQTTTTTYDDTIKFVNNTFFNNSSYQLLSWQFVDYIEYDHNTMLETTLNAHWAPFLTNAKFTNNIFFNYQVVGETTYETEHGYWDKGGANGNHRSSICKLDLVDPQVLLDHGMTEADRKVEYSNNVYFWTQEVKNYWTTHKDSSTGVELDILPVLWMNDYTKAMFDDNSGYPYFVEENNIEADPGFNADIVSALWKKELPFVINYRRHGYGGMVDPKERLYAPDGEFWDIAWPLPESLVYTNENIKKHAKGNFPAGDLNWYPDKKAEWEDWVSGISREETINLPSEYELSQNYPNPFNPSTEINFSIPVSANTTLAVYNVLGQKVATLVNEKLSAGSYKYQFDASNLSSGIYFYKLQSDDYSQVRKMMLLK